jgi:CRP/FNR family transcriptional regulator, cyclic AMP receptor protein
MYALASLPFSNLIRQHLLPMEGVTKLAHCRRFTILYASGSPADSTFFLDSGLVKISRPIPQGKELLVSIVHPGELFGEQSILLGGPRRSSAEVLHESTIYVIPKELFLRFSQEQPEVWRLMAELTARREMVVEDRLEMVLAHDVRERILLSLADLAEVLGTCDEEGSGQSIPISQVELASMVGATRETTSSALNALARRGLVTLGRRRMVVSSPERLRMAAEESRIHTAAN